MIDGLVAGKVFGQPKQGRGKNGMYATAKVRVTTDQDTIFINVICFNEKTCTQLLALNDGDAVALSGSLTPKVWEAKDGARPVLDMVAHGVLTAYHVSRKRKAIQGEPDPERR